MNETIQIRPYQESDKASLLSIFEANIREEWGERYHQGKYISNAEQYIETVVSDPQSDLPNIPQVYLEPGGDFWILEEIDTQKVVGMVGLQILSLGKGEIRRNCILPEWRGNGWGTRLCHKIQERARQLKLKRLICSTPEHGDDVIRFYRRLGFTEYSTRKEMHGTPIKEVFLEWHVK